MFKTKFNLFFDGACEPFNPRGIATWGIVIFNDKEELIISKNGLACKPFLDISTNNYAEYTALIEGFKICIDINVKDINVFGDSKLIIEQMNNNWNIRSPNIINLYLTACEFRTRFNTVDFKWIPRKNNFLADQESKKAYEAHLDEYIDQIIIPFGKFKNKKIVDINSYYLNWLITQVGLKKELKVVFEKILKKRNKNEN